MNTILTLLIVLNIFSSDHNGIGRIAEANKQKSAGEEAFIAKDYKTAIDAYTILLDSMNIEDDAAMLDLAHSYFLTEDKENATKRYASIQNSADKKIASIANQQLGVLKAQEQKIEEALAFLKTAMKHDPQNIAARYDYEMLLKQKKEQEQQQQDQNQDQDNKDQNEDKKDQDQKDQDQKDKDQEGQDENQDQKDQEKGDQKDDKDQKDSEKGDQEGDQNENQEQEGEQGEETEEERKEREKAEEQANFNNRMEEIKMPASQAQMILDALKNKEVQYFQQQKKKSKKQDRNKPDW
ncbi:M48 family metallopeptidase [Flammeovirga sp. EKP202]|uniref:tetratricopeptide repeat protein n=1 Tax=Flammeovirga sp. EKP202 TaxID=2770592 RepID=UPI00165FEE3F|nr:hypothetical protein [Flammeovirga sp. EKP202]MBD0400424.1 hypothetical protein [Flammeovirga sp. EKP202]